MSGLIFLFAIASTYAVFRGVGRVGIRDAAAAAWMVVSLFVYAASELLSAVHALRQTGIAVVWLALCAVAFGLLLIRTERLPRLFAEERRAWLQGLALVRGAVPVLYWGGAAILALTAVHACLAPPFEADALSYHLPRAQHWLANGSISFYETAIARQNYQPPGFSLAVCHLLALTGTDRWLNVLQWGSFLVSAGVVSLIAHELGAGLKGQAVSAFLSLTLPSAISQSLTCVNDLFAALPVAYFVLALLRLRGCERNCGWWAIAASVALGAALLAKWTSLIYVAIFSLPVSAAVLIQAQRRGGGRGVLRMATLLSGVAAGGLACIAPHCLRNMRAYGNPFSGDPPAILTNVRLTPEKFKVNVARHLATHLALPCASANRLLERVVTRVSGDLVNDPDITYSAAWFDTRFRLVSPLGKATSWASNPLHFLLFSVVWAAWLFDSRRQSKLLALVGLPVLVCSALYCLVFKWQPWFVRLQIPLFLMMAAGLGVWQENFRFREAVVRGVLPFLAGYALLHTVLRPTWYMPGFLFGRMGDEKCDASARPVGEKIKALVRDARRAETVRKMRQTVPSDLAHGYSLFYTPRERQYFGNETYEAKGTEYLCVKELAAFLTTDAIRETYSDRVGLLFSSDNGNTPPEKGRIPFSEEYALWAVCGNVAAQSSPTFYHVLSCDSCERSVPRDGEKPRLLVSDSSRDRLLAQIRQGGKWDCLMSNALFQVYGARGGR